MLFNRLAYDGVLDDHIWLKYAIAIMVMTAIYPPRLGNRPLRPLAHRQEEEAKLSQLCKVNEPTGQQVNEFFEGGSADEADRSDESDSPTNQMGEHPIELPRGDGIILTSLTS